MRGRPTGIRARPRVGNRIRSLRTALRTGLLVGSGLGEVVLCGVGGAVVCSIDGETVLSAVGGTATAASLPSPDGAVEKPHALYVEGLGKGGLYGVGYDYQIERWLAAGALVSYAVVDGQHVAGVSPYVGLYLRGASRHRLFLHGGPQLVHVRTPSPVPEWPGHSALSAGGQVAVGYEYRRGLLVRVALMAAAGKGGIAPWLGLSLGWTR